MTEKAKKNWTTAGKSLGVTIIISLFLAIAGSVGSKALNNLIEAKSIRLNEMEVKIEANTRDIQTIKDTMPTEKKIDELLEKHDDRLIRLLFEKGYIQSK